MLIASHTSTPNCRTEPAELVNARVSFHPHEPRQGRSGKSAQRSSPGRDNNRPGNDRVEAVRSRTRDAARMLPGALLLLAFQLFAAYSGAINRLQPPEQAAFALSLLSVALSIATLGILVRRRATPVDAKEVEARLETASALMLAGMGALGGGLASDFFVIATRLTGSPGEGGLVGALILALVYLPWL